MLRALCDVSVPREQRQQLAQSFNHHAFIKPEHQVVFESIRALLSHGEVTVARLNVHLNNRGFPDTDVEKYFRSATNDSTQEGRSNQVRS